MNTPDKIIIHHSGGTDANPLADTSNQTAEIIKSWHLQKGWSDIGYNWVIEKTGKVVKGRDEDKDGAHTIGQNSSSIGICVVGNFDATYPTKEQETSLSKLMLDIITRYPAITKEAIYPHRKYAVKTCYGNHLKDDWAKNLIKEPQKEIKDDSADCKAYLAKQDVSTKISFLSWFLTLFK